MLIDITHLIRDHQGAAGEPFTGRNISEIVRTYVDRDKALTDYSVLSSLPKPLSVIGYRLGDAKLEI
jgi:hypothetical protein